MRESSEPPPDRPGGQTWVRDIAILIGIVVLLWALILAGLAAQLRRWAG